MASVVQTLQAADYPWPMPEHVASIGSTNAELLARAGAPEGTALIADEQTAGRGRVDRTWVSKPCAGVWCSVLVCPGEDASLLPIVAGLAVTDALQRWADVQLKWPNDIWTERGKLGGVLVEARDVLAIGIGVNLTDAPVPGSTALADLVQPTPRREDVFASILIALALGIAAWRSQPALVIDRYRARCATLGAEVTVELPGGERFTGVGEDVDRHGHLLVRTSAGVRNIAAGDVVHATLQP
jgi:BirA family biotin operon repressor/biotin-[acetyl-CoA-carboxylase] ligase